MNNNARSHTDCTARSTLLVLIYVHLCFLCSDQLLVTDTHTSNTYITHSWHNVDIFINCWNLPTWHRDLTVNWPCVLFWQWWTVSPVYTLRSSIAADKRMFKLCCDVALIFKDCFRTELISNWMNKDIRHKRVTPTGWSGTFAHILFPPWCFSLAGGVKHMVTGCASEEANSSLISSEWEK